MGYNGFFIELVLDLIFEGSIELSNNKKVPKWIRYILITFIVLFFIIIYMLLIFVSLLFFKESILGGIFIFILTILFVVIGIIKFKKMYLKKKDDK